MAGGGLQERILAAEVVLELPEVPCGAQIDQRMSIDVRTVQGNFTLRPLQSELGVLITALDGRVKYERVPVAEKLTSGSTEEDYPDCSVLGDSSVLCAYVEYDLGVPVDTEATLAGDFNSLRASGNGDRVFLVHHDGAHWHSPVAVTGSARDIWRPVVAAHPGGGAMIVWAEQRQGDWDLFGRSYDPSAGLLGAEVQLTEEPGSDFHVVVSGEYMAWQARRDGDFDIYASRMGGRSFQVSFSEANDWRPSIRVDSNGVAWIAWDTYDEGNYDVYLRRFDGENLGESIAVAQSPRFEARASVAIDPHDRVWVAFEDSATEWGKDAGDRWLGMQATPMYVDKNILVRVWDGSLQQTELDPKAPTVDYQHDDSRIATSQRHKISIPRLEFDTLGRLWLFFRKHPLQTGRGERWRSYAMYYKGDEWSAPVPIPFSDNLLDRQPGLAALKDGSLLSVQADDGRVRQVRDRKNSGLYVSVVHVEGAPSAPELKLVDSREPRSMGEPVHPNETEQIAHMRAARVNVGGKSLRFLRGEFHRHTEFSSHRDWDGPFEEVWRYGLDVADMDWIGPGDHDYAIGQDYLWWLQQKASDIYHDPQQFSALYTYERSVVYPSGHRNVMLPERGVRTLPRMQGRKLVYGTERDGSADIRNLYAYLEEFGGICSSHTSATNMGTDWRDADESVEPVVEIFQGHRQSYERSGAPLAAHGEEDTIQGYRPKGFVWEAFRKGRRLGFQASSDHVSTHISYGVVLAEENSREGIIDSFRQRHSYAANDNIALVVRSGDHLMGDEFKTDKLPSLQIQVTGTAPVDRVDIIRQVGLDIPQIIAAFNPGERVVDLNWTDSAAITGEWNMYYVRLKQRNEALAWASPLWILYQQ